MAPDDILDLLRNQLQKYCDESHTEAKSVPFVFFLPPQKQVNLQMWVTKNIPKNVMEQWLIFSTYGSFNDKQAFFPILQVIREMLFIDEELLLKNAALPEEEQLPQIGNYLIPEFLQDVPQIEKLYALMAEVSTEAERSQLFAEAQKVVETCVQNLNNRPITSNPSQIFFQVKKQTNPPQENLYETLLLVFRRMIAELFQMEGMVFIFNRFSLKDDITLKWLQYSACFPFKEEIPLFIIVESQNETEHQTLLQNLENWPKKGRFFVETMIDSELKYDKVQPYTQHQPTEDSHVAPSSSSPSKKFQNSASTAEKLVAGAKELFQHLQDLGYI